VGIRADRSARRPALAAAALALLVVPAVATAAAPGVQDGLLTSDRADVDQRLAMIEASGARVARVEVLWSEVAPRAPLSPGSPADPAYRFERLDAVVAGLAEREITPIITVYSAPAWAVRGRRASPGRVNAFAPAPSRFGVFMQAIAHRYSGSYADILRGTLPRVRHFELWNRPNDARFLRPQRSGGRATGLAAYVAMVRAATPRIRRMNASAVVIAGAAAGTASSSATGTAARTWLRGLARSRAAFDAYSQQLQPVAGPRQPTRAFPSWRSIGELEAELDAVPRRRGMALYITRAGYRTAPPSGRGALPEARQASYLRQIWELPAIRSPRVPAVIWHDLQDGPGTGFGLLRADGTPKPSHAAFARLGAPLRALPSELHR
jgi:hypothetical protein